MSFSVVLLFLSIGFVFWNQNWKYLMPTPIPKDYQPILPTTKLKLGKAIHFQADRPVFLYFFSPDCPCSKFNLSQFKDLVAKYKGQVDFYGVLFVEDDTYTVDDFYKQYDIQIPLIIKNGEAIADMCGVYATPQAVIMTSESTLFYRGNYNKTRYCTDKTTNFAEIALSELLKGHKPPDFGKAATMSYGCEVPK